jgi:hypothetical protein
MTDTAEDSAKRCHAGVGTTPYGAVHPHALPLSQSSITAMSRQLIIEIEEEFVASSCFHLLSATRSATCTWLLSDDQGTNLLTTSCISIAVQRFLLRTTRGRLCPLGIPVV